MAESILKFFPGFDAFKLPPPSSDPEVVLNLNRDEVQQDVNKSFVRGVQEFKALLRSKLSPKRSFNDGEYVTGEGRWIPQPSPPYPSSPPPPPSCALNLLNSGKLNLNFLMSMGNGRSAQYDLSRPSWKPRMKWKSDPYFITYFQRKGLRNWIGIISFRVIHVKQGHLFSVYFVTLPYMENSHQKNWS